MAQFDSETAREAGQKSSRAGIPNKETARRDWITSFLNDYTNEKLKEDFNSLSPGERIKIAVKLMEYDTPKLRTVEISPIEVKRYFGKLEPEEIVFTPGNGEEKILVIQPTKPE